jgi:hypothetical protein
MLGIKTGGLENRQRHDAPSLEVLQSCVGRETTIRIASVWTVLYWRNLSHKPFGSSNCKRTLNDSSHLLLSSGTPSPLNNDLLSHCCWMAAVSHVYRRGVPERFGIRARHSQGRPTRLRICVQVSHDRVYVSAPLFFVSRLDTKKTSQLYVPNKAPSSHPFLPGSYIIKQTQNHYDNQFKAKRKDEGQVCSHTCRKSFAVTGT